MKILLIAGHGNGDCGATGCGYKEADLTREMVDLIKTNLQDYATVEVADKSKNWFNHICEKGNTFDFKPYKYVLEVHFNACVNDTKGNGKTTGTEIYVTTSENGVTVEENIVKNIATLGLKNRGVKRKNFALIKYIKKQGVSSALLETCFIDDADDVKIYKENKTKIAEAITKGIVDGFGLKKVAKKEVAKKEPVAEKILKVDPAKNFDKRIAGTYRTTTALNLRYGAGTSKESIRVMSGGTTVACYGYYTPVNGTKWYLIICDGKTGFASSKYLKKL